jgi:hypothetical protein
VPKAARQREEQTKGDPDLNRVSWSFVYERLDASRWIVIRTMKRARFRVLDAEQALQRAVRDLGTDRWIRQRGTKAGPSLRAEETRLEDPQI